MNEKQINRLLMIGYGGIVIAYGILLWAKLKTKDEPLAKVEPKPKTPEPTKKL